MTMYYWPLSPERDARVRRRVAERIGERGKANRDAWKMLPGMKNLQAPERLAFYEAQGSEYWQAIAASRPDEARAMFLDFAQLVREYRGQLASY